MKLNLDNLELKDVILFLGIIGSIYASGNSSANSANRVESTYQEVQELKANQKKNDELNLSQTLIMERTTVILSGLLKQVETLQSNQNWLMKTRSGARNE